MWCTFPTAASLVIDAKFPLEAVTAFREATSRRRPETCDRIACVQDIDKHIGDIAEKYLIPGETQDMALMFVPSESVYAELYDGFDDIVQKAYRAKVIIVSPSLLMLAIQVIQQIRKDARMREAAERDSDRSRSCWSPTSVVFETASRIWTRISAKPATISDRS